MSFVFLKLTLIILVGVSFLFLACRSKQDNQSSTQAVLQVEQINLEQLNSKLKTENGKLKIVNVWASWCDPCKAEMPNLMKLRNMYSENLDLFIISIDEPEILDSVVKPILKQSGVDFLTYIKQEGNDEEFINGLNPEWNGALPATFIYDSSGKQVEFMIGEQTAEQFEAAVKKYSK
jgi:thiol-disulfide isomerase/thioredoxin